MALLMITVWRKNLIFPAAFYIVFASIELTYVSSALRKVRCVHQATAHRRTCLPLALDPRQQRPSNHMPTDRQLVLRAGATGRLVQPDDGGNLRLHHAAVVFRLLPPEKVRISPRPHLRSAHGVQQ